MEKPNPWHEDNDFWETCAPILFTQQRRLNAAGEIEQLVTLLKIKPGAHILDLCCGVGRHSLELARRGFTVTGVDRTNLYLDEAARLAEDEKLKVEFVQDDMRAFLRPEAFDAIINLFTSFGYFEKPKDDRQVIENVYRSLKPGGIFLIDIMGKEVLARIFQERVWSEQDGTLILQEHNITNNWSWIENRWIIIKDDKRTEFKITHRVYSATELASLLTGCGFRQAEAFGDLSGSPYDHTARRLVIVAHK